MFLMYEFMGWNLYPLQTDCCRNSKNASAGYICGIDHLRNPGPGKTKSSRISRGDPVSGLVSRDVSADIRNAIIAL